MLREGDRVVTRSDPSLHDIPHAQTGTPTYDGLPLGNSCPQSLRFL